MKALIAMSGGVDSSVAAKLTVDAGYECIGCSMKLYNNEDAGVSPSKTCCSLDDFEDARSVAYRLGMQYYVFNFTDEFKDKVIDKFVQSYLNGRTPNPCIDCNRYMKFEKLFERAKVLGCDKIVTGHYARVEQSDKGWLLKKAVDETKDQSYVLYSLTQEQLSRILFPLGSMRKTETREIAEANGFVNASKPDSQDICFVPDGDYARVIELHSGYKSEEGDFVDLDGNVIGRHRGIIHYTIGQRKGLGMAFHKPMYVKSIDPSQNTVMLCEDIDLYTKEVLVTDFNRIIPDNSMNQFKCKAKIRYRHREDWATVIPLDSSNLKIIFDNPQRAVTPGQAAVLYDGDTVIGGGVIV